MFGNKTQLHKVIDHQEQAINKRKNKTNFNDPGEGQFEFRLSQFSFDFVVFFNGKLLSFLGILDHILVV